MKREAGSRNGERRLGREAFALRRGSSQPPASEFLLSRPRRAFTLLETMLVLALFVVVSALAWPQLSKPFEAQHLRKSADQLHADLTRARATAIRTGCTQQFTITSSTTVDDGRGALPVVRSSYHIAPVTDAMAGNSSAGFDPMFSDPLASAGQTYSLPEGITLAAVEAVDDVSPAPQAGGFSLPPAPTDGASTTSTVFFHPDGTTSSARFTLVNEQGLMVRVELRGLTGVVAKSDVLTSESSP